MSPGSWLAEVFVSCFLIGRLEVIPALWLVHWVPPSPPAIGPFKRIMSLYPYLRVLWSLLSYLRAVIVSLSAFPVISFRVFRCFLCYYVIWGSSFPSYIGVLIVSPSAFPGINFRKFGLICGIFYVFGVFSYFCDVFRNFVKFCDTQIYTSRGHFSFHSLIFVLFCFPVVISCFFSRFLVIFCYMSDFLAL